MPLKKKSKAAKAWGQKMAALRREKRGVSAPVPSALSAAAPRGGRLVKGSEEAKAWGQRMAALRRQKGESKSTPLDKQCKGAGYRPPVKKRGDIDAFPKMKRVVTYQRMVV